MRLILDTNILLSALIVRGTPPEELYNAWKQGRFILISSEPQIEEMKAVLRRPFFQDRVKPWEAGLLINHIRQVAEIVTALPDLEISSDPNDDFLLAMAQVSGADYLVTGDKRDLLLLDRFGRTKILTARVMLEYLR
ncbi:putative toxin-antitoxin system toxin component, PIN family [Acidithiobacillus sp. IBUN Pt1247-S3]|uniref:putative toxin-antitoxin system toxin component, PIN family n=1 Tax=Acidithiobacillus sp. IBUN Pt1247-S3 TaxID=3166642 RepID=UPI0034E4BBA2